MGGTPGWHTSAPVNWAQSSLRPARHPPCTLSHRDARTVCDRASPPRKRRPADAGIRFLSFPEHLSSPMVWQILPHIQTWVGVGVRRKAGRCPRGPQGQG